MELADKMFVNYQAVSNWERGNTMPDISKLLELAQILGVRVDELLGSEKEADIVNKIVEKSDDIKMGEVAEAAGFMKPSQIDEAVDNASKKLFDIDNLIPLAPFLDQDELSHFAEQIFNSEKDASILIALAPFLDEESLGRFVNSMTAEHKE
jgi:transcriptional regulator with XRE-family HTH domain